MSKKLNEKLPNFLNFSRDKEMLVTGGKKEICEIYSSSTLDLLGSTDDLNLLLKGENHGISATWSHNSDQVIVTTNHFMLVFVVNRQGDPILNYSRKISTNMAAVITRDSGILICETEIRLSLSNFHRSIERKTVALDSKDQILNLRNVNVCETSTMIILLNHQYRIKTFLKKDLKKFARTGGDANFVALKEIYFRSGYTILGLKQSGTDIEVLTFEKKLKHQGRIRSIRGEQQNLRSFDIEPKSRHLVTLASEVIDIWKLPGESDPVPESLGTPVYTFSTSVSTICKTCSIMLSGTYTSLFYKITKSGFSLFFHM